MTRQIPALPDSVKVRRATFQLFVNPPGVRGRPAFNLKLELFLGPDLDRLCWFIALQTPAEFRRTVRRSGLDQTTTDDLVRISLGAGSGVRMGLISGNQIAILTADDPNRAADLMLVFPDGPQDYRLRHVPATHEHSPRYRGHHDPEGLLGYATKAVATTTQAPSDLALQVKALTMRLEENSALLRQMRREIDEQAEMLTQMAQSRGPQPMSFKPITPTDRTQVFFAEYRKVPT